MRLEGPVAVAHHPRYLTELRAQRRVSSLSNSLEQSRTSLVALEQSRTVSNESRRSRTVSNSLERVSSLSNSAASSRQSRAWLPSVGSRRRPPPPPLPARLVGHHRSADGASVQQGLAARLSHPPTVEEQGSSVARPSPRRAPQGRRLPLLEPMNMPREVLAALNDVIQRCAPPSLTVDYGSSLPQLLHVSVTHHRLALAALIAAGAGAGGWGVWGGGAGMRDRCFATEPERRPSMHDVHRDLAAAHPPSTAAPAAEPAAPAAAGEPAPAAETERGAPQAVEPTPREQAVAVAPPVTPARRADDVIMTTQVWGRAGGPPGHTWRSVAWVCAFYPCMSAQRCTRACLWPRTPSFTARGAKMTGSRAVSDGRPPGVPRRPRTRRHTCWRRWGSQGRLGPCACMRVCMRIRVGAWAEWGPMRRL
jgi:hypothetical protein